MNTKYETLRKELIMFNLNDIKPNFTALGKKYNLDPRTVKKYYNGYNGKADHRDKPSKLDKYFDIIKEKLSYQDMRVSGLHFFLKDTKGYDGSYNSLTYYIRKHPELKNIKKDNSCHARYETDIGEQLQFDWVEDLTMINKYGEEFKFNIFSAELCYSRLHCFVYSEYKTREDVFNCLIASFKYFGGVTKSALTDNMSSIVNTKDKKFLPEFIAFAKDMGIDPRKCRVRHPYTKGKVEVRNKFIKWLVPYNHEFETKEDLIKIIKKINIEVNNKVNATTQMKPILLFQKEKEYLLPLASNTVLEHYMNLCTSVNVQNTALFYYKGSQYSVSPKYINKTLKVKEIDNKLYIYYNTDLVIMHELSNKKINYDKSSYIETLKSSMHNKSDKYIEDLAEKNLRIFDEIANLKKGEK